MDRIPPAKIESWVHANFDVKVRKGGDELVICNPFDGSNKRKFNISTTKGVCFCWTGDEWAGPKNPKTGKRNCSFIRFVQLYRKCTYQEALREVLGATEDISSYMRPRGRTTDLEAKKTISVALPEGTTLLTAAKDRQATILTRWLASRGYSKEDIAKYELYHLGMDVYWPYFEFDILVYWQSRSRLNKRFNFPEVEILDANGAVVAITEGSKGDFLYGFDDVEAASYLILTEAIFDKHTLGAQTLASGGAILTPKQINKIKILGPKQGVILAPDNDIAGIKSILANATLLTNAGIRVFFSIPPELEYIENGIKRTTKDWNELLTGLKLPKQEIREICDSAIQKATATNLVKLRSKIRPKRI